MQDPQFNHYLIVEPDTKLLMSVSAYQFEEIRWNVLTWFTACNSFDTIIDECSNCDLCVAGIKTHRLYYDEEYRVIMLLPKDNQSQWLDKIKVKLFSQETGLSLPWFHLMLNASGNNPMKQNFHRANLRCSKGNFVEENQSQSLQLVDKNEISTEFNVEY